jgi:hypothetical protein
MKSRILQKIGAESSQKAAREDRGKIEEGLLKNRAGKSGDAVREGRRMTDSEKIEFLAGRVHALLGFATAVITSHPNPSILAQHLEKIGEINLARAESETVSDDYVEGVLDIKNQLKRAVETVLAQKIDPKR